MSGCSYTSNWPRCPVRPPVVDLALVNLQNSYLSARDITGQLQLLSGFDVAKQQCQTYQGVLAIRLNLRFYLVQKKLTVCTSSTVEHRLEIA